MTAGTAAAGDAAEMAAVGVGDNAIAARKGEAEVVLSFSSTEAISCSDKNEAMLLKRLQEDIFDLETWFDSVGRQGYDVPDGSQMSLTPQYWQLIFNYIFVLYIF